MTADFLPGLLWVENRIHQLSAELSRPVDCLEWPRPIDANAKKIPLKIWRCGDFRTVEFRRKEMGDVEGDPLIQRWLGERIKEGLG
jgi:hypothetical protein